MLFHVDFLYLQMDSNFFLLFFWKVASFILASRLFLHFEDDMSEWTSKEWLEHTANKYEARYTCEAWSDKGVIIQVAKEREHLGDALKKSKDLRYNEKVKVLDILAYFSRFKFPRQRNIIPAVSSRQFFMYNIWIISFMLSPYNLLVFEKIHEDFELKYCLLIA